MRIVYVIGTSTGGVGTHVRALARDVAVAGHEVGVIGPRATDDHFGFSRLPGVRFAALDMGTGIGPGDVGLVIRLRALLDSFSADLVHAHGFRAGLVALLATRSLPARPSFVVSLHNQAGGQGLRARVESGIETLLAKGADLTLGASADLVERARALGAHDARFVPAAAPQVRHVLPDAARRTREELALEYGFDPDAIIVLSVGRVAPQKNYPMLVRALGRLGALRAGAPVEDAGRPAEDVSVRSTQGATGRPGDAAARPAARPELVFLVAGAADDAVLEQVRAQHRDLGPATAVPALHFLGPRDDVAELLAAADIYVLTSVWEARALVLQEALIAGRAIVATRGGGTEELIGEAGVLIDSDDDLALASVVSELAAEPGLRAELGARAAAAGARLPDEGDVAEELLTVYSELKSARVGWSER